jgi:hypothetical protein
MTVLQKEYRFITNVERVPQIITCVKNRKINSSTNSFGQEDICHSKNNEIMTSEETNIWTKKEFLVEYRINQNLQEKR